jgi:hypothetical protein
MERDQETGAMAALRAYADMAKSLYRARYKTDYTQAEVQEKLEEAGFHVTAPQLIRHLGIRPASTEAMVTNETKVETFETLVNNKLGVAINAVSTADVKDVAGILAAFSQDVTSLAATM